MSFFKVTEPGTGAVTIADLGIVIAQSAVVTLSNQFSVNDLYLSADLEAKIIAGELTVEIDYGTGFSAVAAVDYTNRDAFAAFLNVYEITNDNQNEKLVDGSDLPTALHHHNGQYFTETELSGTGGAALVGVNDSAWTYIDPASTVQQALTNIDSALSTAITLDAAYDNDPDGILDVDGASKELNLRSNNANDVVISRKSGVDAQDAIRLDVSGNEVILGSLVQGALPEMDVRIKTDLVIEGNLTVTGTVTDSTVNELNVTNANIRLRDGATAIPGADAHIEVERGTSGADAQLNWNETSDRWQAGTVGDLATIALLEKDEVVTGVYEFQGGASTEPSMYLTDKASAPSTALGAAGQIAMASIGNVPSYYDQVRSKWLSIYRQVFEFNGRDSANNGNEYLRAGMFTSNQSSYRLMHSMTLIGISSQTNGAESYTIRIRKNGSVTNLASLVVSAADGAHDVSLNIDFAAGDKLEAYIEGVNVDRPFVVLEFAQKM